MTVSEAVPEIRLSSVSKLFRDVRAVDDISLEIRSGEFFSLLGPSGCGKTTTLRMIGGFELPTGGRIELRGVDMTTAPPDKRPVNMVFQSYALFPHLERRRQRRVRAAPAQGQGARRPAAGRARRSSSSTSRATAGASRTSCPAASSSGSRSPGPSSTGPRSCSSTSRSARST